MWWICRISNSDNGFWSKLLCCNVFVNRLNHQKMSARLTLVLLLTAFCVFKLCSAFISWDNCSEMCGGKGKGRCLRWTSTNGGRFRYCDNCTCLFYGKRVRQSWHTWTPDVEQLQTVVMLNDNDDERTCKHGPALINEYSRMYCSHLVIFLC